MSGTVAVSSTVELKGHLIDSLTLSKVIDRIQQLGGDYRLNDIRVGNLKKDISAINLTLLASDDANLQSLLEAIKPYGALPESNNEVNTVTCQQAGVAPDDAYVVKLPQQAHVQGKWQPLAGGGSWALVLEQGQAKMTPVLDLRQGDILVSGTHGLQW